MFGTKGRKEKPRGLSSYMGYGIKNLKFNRFVIKEAGTGAKRIQAEVETVAIEDENFNPDKTATAGGQVGRVFFTIWLNDTKSYYEAAIEELQDQVAVLATKILGVTDDEETGQVATAARAKFDNDADVSTLEEFVAAMNDHLCGEYVWMACKAEEYQKEDGSISYTLHRRRFGWIASDAEGEGHLDAFDKESVHDYKPFVAPDPEPELATADGSADDQDVPF